MDAEDATISEPRDTFYEDQQLPCYFTEDYLRDTFYEDQQLPCYFTEDYLSLRGHGGVGLSVPCKKNSEKVNVGSIYDANYDSADLKFENDISIEVVSALPKTKLCIQEDVLFCKDNVKVEFTLFNAQKNMELAISFNYEDSEEAVKPCPNCLEQHKCRFAAAHAEQFICLTLMNKVHKLEYLKNEKMSGAIIGINVAGNLQFGVSFVGKNSCCVHRNAAKKNMQLNFVLFDSNKIECFKKDFRVFSVAQPLRDFQNFFGNVTPQKRKAFRRDETMPVKRPKMRHDETSVEEYVGLINSGNIDSDSIGGTLKVELLKKEDYQLVSDLIQRIGGTCWF